MRIDVVSAIVPDECYRECSPSGKKRSATPRRIETGFSDPRDPSAVKGAVRILGVLLLLSLVLGAGVDYDRTYEREWPYPTTNSLVTEYDDSVGERVLLFGTLEHRDGTPTLVSTAPRGTLRVHLRTSKPLPPPGTIVQVYGTIRADHALDTERTVVVQPAGPLGLYKYVASAAGALLVLLAFFRYWRVDIGTASFEVR
jgi:hypothetical protein